MSTCKNCTYWVMRTDQWNKSWTECGAADWRSREEPVEGEDLVYWADAHDDHGLDAGVMTGPDFGCVKWRAI